MRKLVLTTGVLALFAAACSEPPRIESIPSRIEVSLSAPRLSAEEGELLAVARLFDQNDQPLGGQKVEITTTAGTPGAVIDGSDGSYTLRISELRTAGEFTVTATLGELTAETVGRVVPGKVDVARSVLNASPATAAADGVSEVIATVLPLDGYGNVLGETARVTISALATSTSVTPPVWDAEAGLWRASITSTREEQVLVTASVNDFELPSRITVQFVAPTYHVELEPAAPSAQVTQTVALTARVTLGESGHPVPGRTVLLLTDSPSAQLSGSEMIDNGDGTYSGSVSDTRVGTLRVTARDLASSASASAEIAFASAEAHAISITTSGQSVSADAGKMTATARVTDVMGNPIAGQSVTFSSETGSVGPVTDNGDGSYTVEISELTRSGPNRITASLAGLPSAVATVQVNPGAVDVDDSEVTVSTNNVAADGIAATVITVLPVDRHGNRLGPNQRVNIATNRPSAVVSPVIDLGDGTYAATVSSTQAGTVEVTVRYGAFNPQTLTTRPTIVFDAPQYRVQLTASASTLTAGQSTTLTAEITDLATGAPAPGRTLAFDVVAGHGSLGPVVEIAPGIFTAELVNTFAETVLVSAADTASSANGVLPLVYEASPNVATVELSAARTAISADDAEINLTIVVRDTFGNPIPGIASGLSVQPSGGVAASPTPDSTGRAYTSRWNLLTRSGTYTARAMYGTTASNTFILDVSPGRIDTSRSTVEVRPATGVQADGVSSALVIVTPRDRWNNLLGHGLVVNATVTGTGQVQRNPLVDLGDGTYQTTVTNEKAETVTVTATARRGSESPATLAQKQEFSFVAPTHELRMTASPQTLVAGQLSRIRITLRRADGTPVPNRGPALTVSAIPASQVALSPVSDLGDGAYELTASNNGAGTVTLRVHDSTSGAIATQMLTWQPGMPAVLDISSLPATVNADSGEALVTAKLRDQFGNGIPGRTVELSIQSGPGQVSSSTMSGASADGTYRGTVTGLTEAGKQTLVRATSDGLTAATVIHTTVGLAAQIDGFSATETSISADVGTTTLTGTVKDRHGNPVPNEKVALTVNHGSIAGASSATVQTDATGVFTADWTGLGHEGTWKATALVGRASASVQVSVTRGSDAGFLFVDPAQGAPEAPILLSADDFTGGFDLLFAFLDTGGNRLEGRESGFSVKLDGVDLGPVTWDPVRRTYKASIPTLTIGDHTIELADSASGLTATGHWRFTAGVPVTAGMVLSASTVNADDGTLTSTVEVKDAHGNFVSGLVASDFAFVWSPKSPGNAYGAMPPVETSPGVYRIDMRNLRSAGEYQVYAQVKGSVSTEESSVSVEPGKAFLVTQPQFTATINADDGTATATFTVRDAFGNPVSTGSPTVTLAGGNPEATATVSPGEPGAYEVSLQNLYRSTAGGADWTLRAHLGNLQSNATSFVVLSGAPTNATLALEDDSLDADQGSTVAEVAVVDQRGNPVDSLKVSDFKVDWAPEPPSGSVNVTLAAPEPGIYRLNVTGLRTAGAYTASVTVKSTVTTAGAALTITPGVPRSITAPAVTGPISGDAPGPITADVGIGQATFRVRDNFGNGVSGIEPTVILTKGNEEATATVVDLGDGDYRADLANLWRSSGSGVTWRIQIRVNTFNSTTTTFTVHPGPPTGATLTASAETVSADSGAVNLLAAVTDVRGNPVTNLTANDIALSWTVTPPAPYAAGAVVPTTPAGTYRITITGLRTVGTYEAMVTVKGTLVSSSATVEVTAGAPATISAPVLSGPVDADSGTARVDFSIHDAHGNPVVGATPVVQVSGGNADAEAGDVVDAGAGNYHATLSRLYQATSSNADWKVRVSAGSVQSDETSFTVAAGAPSLATTLIGGAENATVGESAALEIQVKDQRENALGEGVAVTLRVKGAGTGGDPAACSVASQPVYNATTGYYDAQVGSTAAQDCIFDAYFGTEDQAFTVDDHTVTFASAP